MEKVDIERKMSIRFLSWAVASRDGCVQLA
jgi:hypothetical protein